MEIIDVFPLLSGIVALISASLLAYYVKKKPAGTEKMKEISSYIYKGALTFLNEEYKIISVFIIIVAVLLLILSRLLIFHGKPVSHFWLVLCFLLWPEI